eukprot:10312131-Heterocapsa_arctica.AAC.1
MCRTLTVRAHWLGIRIPQRVHPEVLRFDRTGPGTGTGRSLKRTPLKAQTARFGHETLREC